jgi:hypothetical protein
MAHLTSLRRPGVCTELASRNHLAACGTPQRAERTIGIGVNAERVGAAANS